MVCEHLRKIIDYAEKNSVEISSSDVIRAVCMKCGYREELPCIGRKGPED